LRAPGRSIAAVLAASSLAAVVGVAAPATAGTTPKRASEVVPDEVLVKMRPGADARGAFGSVRGKSLGRAGAPGWRLVKLPGGSNVDTAVQALNANPNVEAATANHVYHAMTNDSLMSEEWGLTKTAVSSAWSKETGTSSVVVGVVDTGIATDHPDLAPNVVAGAYFTGNSAYDGNGHGTHVAGIIAAVNNDGFGVGGVAPHVAIMPLRVLNSKGSGTTAAIASAFAYAGNHGVKVVNASLGGSSDDQAMEDAITGAPDTLFVFAAGNESANNDSTGSYPCNSPAANVICVAASNSNDGLASFSNYGKTNVDLAAPGVDIVSTYLPGGPASGTKMLSDSPGGPYANNTDSWAQRAVDLTGLSSCTLSYKLRGRVGSGDTLKAERSIDGGTSWSQVGSTFGPSATTHGSFNSYGGSLNADGQPMVLRFHLVADATGTDDGVYVDTVSIQCGAVNVLTDGFESGFTTNWTTGGNGNSWGTTSKAWTWVTLDGTSMATPFVSGAAALLWSYRPTASVARVRNAILRSVDAGSAFLGKTSSGGRLNVSRGLVYVADSTAPSNVGFVGSAMSKAFQKSKYFTVGWTASDSGSGVHSYDIRYERAKYTGGFGVWTTWKTSTTATSSSFTGSPGYTYCFQVRARDHMSNLSGWSSSKCTAVPVDDHSLSSYRFGDRSNANDYLGTHVTGSAKGATLRLYNVSYRRIGLLVWLCSGCGKLAVYQGSTLLGTYSLSSSSTQYKYFISVKMLSSPSSPSTISIKVVSSGAPVAVDALALSRA
jgi:thermitase